MSDSETLNIEKKEECSHIGKWVGLGTSMITMPDGLLVIHNLFCSQCGKTQTSTLEIPFPKKPDIATSGVLNIPKGILKGGKLRN